MRECHFTQFKAKSHHENELILWRHLPWFLFVVFVLLS